MNIILIGYRGTGKSAVGEILAQRLGKKYVGMDAEIVKKAGMGIPEIVEKSGWPGFRDLESQIAEHLSGQDNLVVDTGGGVIERPENLQSLGKNACIFWLKASVDVIVSRIQGDTQRPALTSGKTFTQEIEEVLERRKPKYKEASHFEIDTDHFTPEQVAERIVELLTET
ncbi:MAG: shikimate kinase [Desulfobacteraceae bacterium]|nr:shikimate kinase [Desulfobacteraceae bacterium]MBU4002498.1 shikimate kinase [Pseudomonadota bacterium]